MSDGWAGAASGGRRQQASSSHSPVIGRAIAIIVLCLKHDTPKVSERLDHTTISVMCFRKSATPREINVRLFDDRARILSGLAHVDVCIPGPQAAVARWRRLRRADWWWRRWWIRRRRWTGRWVWRHRWQRRRAGRRGWHWRRRRQDLASCKINRVVGGPDTLARCRNPLDICLWIRLKNVSNLIAGDTRIEVPHHITNPIVGERVFAKVLIAVWRFTATRVT